MTRPEQRPLAQIASESARRAKDQLERDLQEVLAKPAPEPRQFSPAIARLCRRTAPTTTPEICMDVLERLCRDQRVTLYGGQLKFRSASAPSAVPIDTAIKLKTLIRVVLGQVCTIDLAETILEMIGEEHAK